jgi:hypothetical protein
MQDIETFPAVKLEDHDDSDDADLRPRPHHTQESRRYASWKPSNMQIATFSLIFVVMLYALFSKKESPGPQQVVTLTPPLEPAPLPPISSPPPPPEPKPEPELPIVTFILPPETEIPESDKDYVHLSEVCKNTQWRKNLYLNCTTEIYNEFGVKVAIQLGATNLKAWLMSCVRFAVDAGMTMIIPKAPIRLEGDPGQFNQWVDLNFLIDRGYWIQSLQHECPQLNIIDELAGQNIKPQPQVITMKSSGIWPPYAFKKGEYLEKLDETLRNNSIQVDSNGPVSPIIINENEAAFGWRYNMEPNIRLYLRSATRYNESFVDFGKSLSDQIKRDYGQYIGLHLRMEHGWVQLDYPTYIRSFVKAMEADAPDIMTIYVAVGDINIENQFRDDMKKINKTVVSKWDIAFRHQPILDELTTYLFDQRAVVDQIILEQSDFYYGNGGSSLSYIVGANRGDGYISKCNCRLVFGYHPAFNCCI